MLRGYRLLITSACGIALFLTLGIGAFYGSIYAPEKRHYQSVGPNSGQTYPNDSPRNGLADVSGIDRFAQSIIAKPRPRNADEREQRDLFAQEASAAFAYWMIWLVGLQTLLAAGALVALLKDLRQNRLSSEAQLRPYMTVKELDLNRIYDEKTRKMIAFEIHVQWINSGQTPTRQLLSGISWGCVPGSEIPKDFDFPKTGSERSAKHVAVGPGNILRSVAIIPLAQLVESWKGSHTLFYWAWVEYGNYMDMSARHRTETCSRVDIITDPTTIDADPHVSITLHTLFNGADGDCHHPADTQRTANDDSRNRG